MYGKKHEEDARKALMETYPSWKIERAGGPPYIFPFLEYIEYNRRILKSFPKSIYSNCSVLNFAGMYLHQSGVLGASPDLIFTAPNGEGKYVASYCPHDTLVRIVFKYCCTYSLL